MMIYNYTLIVYHIECSCMKYTESIIELAQAQKGIVTSAEVDKAGIPRYYLRQLTDNNLLVKASRGVYALPEAWEDELFILQYTYGKGVFSHETALWLHGFSDRTPHSFTMTFPYGYHTLSLAKQNIKVKKAIKDLYDLGVTYVQSPGGHRLRAYSIERTLCDIVRMKNDMDIQLVQQAMKKYLLSKDKNIPLFLEYAEKVRVIAKVRPYIEVLC